MPVIRTELKTGQRKIQPNIRSFKEGEILFKEGDRGREMFIIQEGDVRITRGEGESRVELATLGKGSVLGEMSLLDNMPRSATGTAVQPTRATIINEMIFNAVLQTVPPWLTSIVRIITSRIRDANKRVGQSILRNREAGVASLIDLLMEPYQKVVGNIVAMDYDLVLLESYYTCKLGRTATESILQGLQRREILEINKDNAGKQMLLFRDPQVLTLFVEYCRLKERGRTFPEAAISEGEVDLLNNVVYVAQKSGREIKGGTELPVRDLMEDLAQKNIQNIEKMLSGLQRCDMITIYPGPEGKENVIFFQKEILARTRKIKEWLDRFAMDLKTAAPAKPPEGKQ